MDQESDDINIPQSKQLYMIGPSTSIPTTQTLGSLGKESPSEFLRFSLAEALEEVKIQMPETINVTVTKATQNGIDEDDNEASNPNHVENMIDQMIEVYPDTKSESKLEEDSTQPRTSISFESILSDSSKLSTSTTLRAGADSSTPRVTFKSSIPDIFEEPPNGSNLCVGQRRNELEVRSGSTSRTFHSESTIIFPSPEDTPTTSIRSIGSLVCRICHNAENPDRLVSPCLCKGSLTYVHVHCLERWIATSRNTSCELCQYHYNTEQTLRYTCIQSLRMWYSRSLSRRALQEDCQMFSLLTLVAFAIMGTLVVGIQYYVVKETNLLGINHAWTKTWLFICLLITLAVYGINIYMILKQQLVPWYHWWQSARDIRLVLENRRPFTLRPNQRSANRPLLSDVPMNVIEPNDGSETNNNNNNNPTNVTEGTISNPPTSTTVPDVSVATLFQPFSDLNMDGGMPIIIEPIYFMDNSESELKANKLETKSLVLTMLKCDHCEV